MVHRLSLSSNSFALEYEKNKILVKFSLNSSILPILKDGKKPIWLLELLGEFNYRLALPERLIDYAEKKYFANTFRHLHSSFEGLRRIVIIEYSKGIDPVLLSRKLKNNPNIEYVEPIYVHKLVKIPSDPRVNQQYYLSKIKVFEAWDLLPSDVDTIVVGIVDTGVDFEHPDLSQNEYINLGEIGVDSLGRDKRTNGVDDDNNGFIDDYRGWDFAGNDNDPKPLNGHGTHVAGIIGATINNDIGGCGIVPKVKLLACKCSPDNNNSTIISGYEALFYAGVMGAKVINCSWGSTGYSNYEQEVINSLNRIGCCVVAAAGNNGSMQDFYPASYDGVLSVAAVDSNDIKASFSNYSNKIGVSAPGVDIYSTVPGNTYAAWDGTSMASPVASGVLALIRQKFQNFSPKQYYEILKKTSQDIYDLNKNFIGLLGLGRVNALNSLSINPDTLKSLILKEIVVDNPLNLIYNGKWEPIAIFVKVENILSPLKSVYIKFSEQNLFIQSILVDSVFLGNFDTGETKNSTESLVFLLTEDVPYDHNLVLAFDVFDTTGKIGTLFAPLVVRPSYRTMSANNISITFNSRGNIGYNDFPNNKQGEGFLFKKSHSLLFEGALMICTSTGKISDVARNISWQNRAFSPDSFFTVLNMNSIDGNAIQYLVGNGTFSDFNSQRLDSNLIGLKIRQSVYQFSGAEDSNFVIIKYQLQNISQNDYDSVYLGLFCDWDISIAGQKDETFFDYLTRFACAYSSVDDTLPFVGTQLLSPFPVNFYAIDNDGGGEDSLSIYDGFTLREKLKTLTNGIARRKSRTTDISYVISAGPFSLKKGEGKQVAFSIFAGKNLAELRMSAFNAFIRAIDVGVVGLNMPDTKVSYKWEVFPNIFQNEINVVFYSQLEQTVEIIITDIAGRILFSKNAKLNPNRENMFSFDTRDFALGNYYVISKIGDRVELKKIAKIK